MRPEEDASVDGAMGDRASTRRCFGMQGGLIVYGWSDKNMHMKPAKPTKIKVKMTVVNKDWSNRVDHTPQSRRGIQEDLKFTKYKSNITEDIEH